MQIVLKLMIFAPHLSELAEMGGIFEFMLRSSNAVASRYSKNWALVLLENMRKNYIIKRLIGKTSRNFRTFLNCACYA